MCSCPQQRVRSVPRDLSLLLHTTCVGNTHVCPNGLTPMCVQHEGLRPCIQVRVFTHPPMHTCSSRAPCPCAHPSCVQKHMRVFVRQLTHSCVCSNRAPCFLSHSCCEQQSVSVCTSVHTRMCMQRQGTTPLHTPLLCVKTDACVCTPAHTRLCLQQQGRIPFHTPCCVENRIRVFTRILIHGCVYNRGHMFLHTLLLCAETIACVCAPARTCMYVWHQAPCPCTHHCCV